MENVEKPQIIDISKMARTLWSKKKLFFKVWGITFVLSCIWIFPQPRYYETCTRNERRRCRRRSFQYCIFVWF